MKHNILAYCLCASILFALAAGCSKLPAERTAQDFSLAVFHRPTPDAPQQAATPLTVVLFRDTGRAVDYTQSAVSVRQSGVMTFTDGTHSASGINGAGSAVGVRVFSGIPNGKYLLWAVYNVRNRDYMVSCVAIEVNDDLQGRMLMKVFTGFTPGYYPWTEGL